MKPTLNICQQALELKNKVEVGFLELGALLNAIKERRLYEQESFESWGEFLMEMRLSQGTASKLITIYNTFVVQYEISPRKIAEAGGYTVVYDLVPLATSKEKAEEWIDKAKSMTRSHIRQEAQSAKGEVEDEPCDHEPCNMCRKCGFEFGDN